MPKDACVFTIISKNYISYARTLFNSFLKYNPGVKMLVLLADKVDGYFDIKKESFEIIEADTLDICDFESFSFKYNIVEFNTAVKPFFFKYLFAKYNFKKVVYFDPDILFFKSILEIFDLLDRYSIVLTPHIISPLPDDKRIPQDIDILKAGCFNLGFIGLSNSPNVDRLLSWWAQRLYDKCLQAPLFGYDVDQAWLSLVTSFFDDYFILKDPGYNVAYWNLHERVISKNEEFLVNNKPLYFFHFSGFNPDDLTKISSFQNRFKVSDIPGLSKIFQIYKESLVDNGYYYTCKLPYHYGFLKNGLRITNFMRRLYWGLDVDYKRFGNPYEGFYKKVFTTVSLKAFFKKRFLLALLDTLFMHTRNILFRKNIWL